MSVPFFFLWQAPKLGQIEMDPPSFFFCVAWGDKKKGENHLFVDFPLFLGSGQESPTFFVGNGDAAGTNEIGKYYLGFFPPPPPRCPGGVFGKSEIDEKIPFSRRRSGRNCTRK